LLHNLPSNTVTGNFNGELEGKLLLVINELSQGDAYRHLKSLISDETMVIHKKRPLGSWLGTGRNSVVASDLEVVSDRENLEAVSDSEAGSDFDAEGTLSC